MLWISVINLVATIALLVATSIYVWLTHRILRAQTIPVVHLDVDRDEQNGVIRLVLRNDGLGPAYEVRVHLDVALLRLAVKGGDLTRGPIGGGVPVLGPRRKVRQIWGHERELAEALGENSLHDALVEWRERRGGPLVSARQSISMSAVDPIRLSKAV